LNVDPDFDWSPDSKFIVGTSPIENKTDNAQLFLFEVGTPHVTFFKPDKRYFAARNPRWSPDGTQIIYDYGVTASDIYAINVDDTHNRQLTNTKSVNKHPIWSPDGKYIAFLSNRNGTFDVYIMHADGTNVVKLTNTLVEEVLMGWVP